MLFLADNRCQGLDVDGGLKGHWSTQGPQYYLWAQLAYDPRQDGDALLKDYYARAYGPAAREMERYWRALDETTEAVMSDPQFVIGNANRRKLPPVLERAYTAERLSAINAHLSAAEKRIEDHDLYRQRVAFARTGFDYTALLTETLPLMTRVREKRDADGAAQRRVDEIWCAIRELETRAPPFALSLERVMKRIGGELTYMGCLQDYFGQPLTNQAANVNQATQSVKSWLPFDTFT